MSKAILGTATLKYDTDGELQIGTFKPMIQITKEQIKTSALGKCSNKTIEEVRECAELLLASFFTKVSDIELRDIEKTQLLTEAVYTETYDNGQVKEVKFEFSYID